ncbi:MAG: mammalian cell entry protein, partial [Mycobacterium sp.]
PGPAPAPAPALDPAALPPSAVTPPGASGASYSTYDQQSGTFIDANGNAAVFGAGATNLQPQENWYDLMKDPRQT